MVRNSLTPDGYLVDNEGILILAALQQNGTTPLPEVAVRNAWKQIDGKWYMFHSDGTMYARMNSTGIIIHKASGEEMADIFDYVTTAGSISNQNCYIVMERCLLLKSGSYMAKSEFIYDPTKATYYLEDSGKYARWLHLQNKWYHSKLVKWTKINGSALTM